MTVSAATVGQLSVVVASKNSVKINAAAAALQRALPGVKHRVSGVGSQSGVPDQPFGDEETLQGAFNRVESIRSLPQHAGCLLVAIEGGVGFAPRLPHPPGGAPHHPAATSLAAARQQVRGLPGEVPQLECFAWVVVRAAGGGAASQARTASFPLPAAIAELVLREGLELGDADDRVFGRVKSGQGSGTIGQLTGGLLTRQSYYEHAVLCALIPLLNPSLFPGFQLAAGQEEAGK